MSAASTPQTAPVAPFHAPQESPTRASATRLLLAVAILALVALCLTALAFREPGYMDAYYYYHVAANIAAGRGLTEDVIWIYLTDPPALTHPSHLYWMPLVSFIALPALTLFSGSFLPAQAPFILLSVGAIAASVVLARQLLPGAYRPLAAALLTLFSGYCFVYWVAIDAFGAYTLAALLAFVATAALLEGQQSRKRAAILGALMGMGTGIAHLARADGPLILVACAVVLLAHRDRTPPHKAAALGAALASYLLVMLPWFLRNLSVSGSPLPPGGLQTIFLTEYNEFFSYGLSLDLAHYLEQGVGAMLIGKGAAALRNLGVLFILQYWLVPFAAFGWWSLRQRPLMAAPLVYATLLYGVMTLLFTYPSGRGAMLHSSIALLPWLSIAAVKGIEVVVYWTAARLPHWKPALATRNFTLLALLAAVLVSGYALSEQAQQWGSQVNAYRKLAPVIFADRSDAVPLVLNAPGWWYATRGPAMQTPSNGREAALAAARRYGATHLILEPARPTAWESFSQKGSDPRFELLYTGEEYAVYRLRLDSK